MGTRRQTITERVSSPFQGCRVDRANGIIHGVKLCGHESANGNDYPAAMFRKDFQRYEGAPIYTDHERGKEHQIARKIGWVSSPTVDAEGIPRGNAHLLKSHPLYNQVMEAAERNPGLYGFSHQAVCQTARQPNGRTRVESIERIESVDLVAEPATTKGLFESRNRGGNVAFTVKLLTEWVQKAPKASRRQIVGIKKLAEMEGMSDVPVDAGGADGAPEDGCEPGDAIKSGFKSGIHSLVDKAMDGEMDQADALKTIKKLLTSHADVNGPKKAADDDDDENDEDDETEKESRKRPSPNKVIAECTAAGFEASVAELAILFEVRDPRARALFIADRRKTLAEDQKQPPKSGAKKPGVSSAAPKKLAESKETDAAEVTDGKSFLTKITGRFSRN